MPNEAEWRSPVGENALCVVYPLVVAVELLLPTTTSTSWDATGLQSVIASRLLSSIRISQWHTHTHTKRRRRESEKRPRLVYCTERGKNKRKERWLTTVLYRTYSVRLSSSIFFSSSSSLVVIVAYHPLATIIRVYIFSPAEKCSNITSLAKELRGKYMTESVGLKIREEELFEGGRKEPHPTYTLTQKKLVGIIYTQCAKMLKSWDCARYTVLMVELSFLTYSPPL